MLSGKAVAAVAALSTVAILAGDGARASTVGLDLRYPRPRVVSAAAPVRGPAVAPAPVPRLAAFDRVLLGRRLAAARRAGPSRRAEDDATAGAALVAVADLDKALGKIGYGLGGAEPARRPVAVEGIGDLMTGHGPADAKRLNFGLGDILTLSYRAGPQGLHGTVEAISAQVRNLQLADLALPPPPQRVSPYRAVLDLLLWLPGQGGFGFFTPIWVILGLVGFNHGWALARVRYRANRRAVSAAKHAVARQALRRYRLRNALIYWE